IYLLPSTSHTRAPFALLTKNGWPPTARNARTGEFTPPGMYFSASAKSCSDMVRGFMAALSEEGTRGSRAKVNCHENSTSGVSSRYPHANRASGLTYLTPLIHGWPPSGSIAAESLTEARYPRVALDDIWR